MTRRELQKDVNDLPERPACRHEEDLIRSVVEARWTEIPGALKKKARRKSAAQSPRNHR